MLIKIKNLISYLRQDISKSFCYSQANFDQILKDNFKSFYKLLDRKFNIIEGVEKSFLDEKKIIIKFFNEKKKPRAFFSEGVEFDYIPNTILKIISKNINPISRYLGKRFVYENPIFFRNYNFDLKLKGYDIYSNVWHQDSHDGSRLLKIFILTDSVNENDGPLEFLTEEQTKNNWQILKDRWHFKVFQNKNKILEAKKFIGEAGSYAILDTSRSMHKAGIPNFQRDILQITLYPIWRKNKNRYEFKL
jgi:hypothetical protein